MDGKYGCVIFHNFLVDVFTNITSWITVYLTCIQQTEQTAKTLWIQEPTLSGSEFEAKSCSATSLLALRIFQCHRYL